jgi:hypothetical protein
MLIARYEEISSSYVMKLLLLLSAG